MVNLLVVEGGLVDEEAVELGGVDVAGKRRVEIGRGGTTAAKDRADVGRERVDPGRVESGPVELEMKAELVDQRNGRASVEVGGKEGRAGNLGCVLAEL